MLALTFSSAKEALLKLIAVCNISSVDDSVFDEFSSDDIAKFGSWLAVDVLAAVLVSVDFGAEKLLCSLRCRMWNTLGMVDARL